MLTHVHPKLPMRHKRTTRDFYTTQLGFSECGSTDYEEYLMLKKDGIEIHFFLFETLNVHENYGQVYIRTHQIEEVYRSIQDRDKKAIHPNGQLELKSWGQKEFSVLDPDHNLLTFGEAMF